MPKPYDRLYRLTDEAQEALLSLPDKQEVYLNPHTDFGQILRARDVEEYAEPVPDVTVRGDLYLPPPDAPGPASDTLALDYHRRLQGLTPQMALEPRLWAWVCHFPLHAYALRRWDAAHANKNLERAIRQHWFVENRSSGLRIDNAGSRLYWMAHLARKAAAASEGAIDDPQTLVNMFAARAEKYHTLTKYSFLYQDEVLAEVCRALLDVWEALTEKGYQKFIRALNRRSGISPLGFLPRPLLRQAVGETLDAILSDPDNVNVKHRASIRNRTPVRVLSVGAGVQSTVLALMMDQGWEGLQPPDYAVFADTGWEPQAVYDHLDWLQSELSFAIAIVRRGNLRQDIMAGTTPNGGSFVGIPAHVRGLNGELAGMGKRQCTVDYKTEPIRQFIRRQLGVEAGAQMPKALHVEMILGISVDEELRAKPSRDQWITRVYPLVQKGYSRAQLLKWFQERYPDRSLPRSACIGCPYKSDSEWAQTQADDPKAFFDAVQVDTALREDPRVRAAITPHGGAAYLHRSGQPLALIDFSQTRKYDSLMEEECEGVCGI